MDLERFDLEGVSYYLQGRKCGKAGCKCSSGQLHGPYWYSRDQTTGKVSYIGRELPAEIKATRFAHDTLLPEMVATRRKLINQADALARLIRNAPLSLEDRAVIHELGFGVALVHQASSVDTQDDAQQGTLLV